MSGRAQKIFPRISQHHSDHDFVLGGGPERSPQLQPAKSTKCFCTLDSLSAGNYHPLHTYLGPRMSICHPRLHFARRGNLTNI
ncbi:hypothetical protein KSP40_PGU005069 [Platanthera guangdongensis]|uniref:Uncharacterized protein n=1 Tax=Platanthera guangdongensis TaxID=2320717 RepID=A0ABR2M807_9ASPA